MLLDQVIVRRHETFWVFFHELFLSPGVPSPKTLMRVAFCSLLHILQDLFCFLFRFPECVFQSDTFPHVYRWTWPLLLLVH